MLSLFSTKTFSIVLNFLLVNKQNGNLVKILILSFCCKIIAWSLMMEYKSQRDQSGTGQIIEGQYIIFRRWGLFLRNARGPLQFSFVVNQRGPLQISICFSQIAIPKTNIKTFLVINETHISIFLLAADNDQICNSSMVPALSLPPCLSYAGSKLCGTRFSPNNFKDFFEH